MIRHCEGKMVVLLATALALGVGAVAACVVPWFYCKPPDAADEDREATGIREGTDPGPHSRSVNEENPGTATNIRINGFSYVRVMVPPTPLTGIHSTISTRTTQDSSILNAFCQENCIIEGAGHPAQTVDVQPFGNTGTITSGVINSESIRMDDICAESTRKSDNSEALFSKSETTQPSESDYENSGASHSGFIDSGTLKVKLSIKNEGIAFATLPNHETSNPTNESSTEPTNRTLSVTSGLLNSEIIQTDDADSEAKDILSSVIVSRDSESLATASLTKVEETYSMTLTTSDSSNPTDESTTETTNRSSTFQESMNFSSGPTRVLTYAIVESPEISDMLETIPEVSNSTASSFEPSLKIPQQVDYNLPRINETPNVWVGNEESITFTPTRASNRVDIRSVLPNRTLSILGSPHSKRQDAEIRKKSRSSRYALAISGRFKKIWRGIKVDATPRSSRNKKDQHVESISSLSAEKKNPTGHSTLISEEQDFLEIIRTRRSPKTLNTCTLKMYDDPGISNNNNLNYVPQFDEEIYEEPLDLSIRSSSECSNEKTGDTSTRRKSLSRAGSCREVFREVAEYLKVRRGSKSSEDGVTLSDSLMFCGEVSKICMKDENQNVTSDFSKFGDLKVEEPASCVEDLEADRLENGCLPKSNGFPRRIKRIFHIGSKNRKKSNKILESMRKGEILNSVPVEYQRNSTGSQLKSEINANILSVPDSLTDVSSYFELGFAASDNKRYFDVPCTEL